MEHVLEFDEETHIYKVSDKILPSVTQILTLSGMSNFDFVDPELLQYKADIGRKVHKACQWFDEGCLDEETLHPIIQGYLLGWKRFRQATEYQPVEHEIRMFSKKHGFAGTIDSVGKRYNILTLVDIKTGVTSKAHPLQTAAYKVLYDENRGEKIKTRLVVYLSKGGEYRVEPNKVGQDKYEFLRLLQGVQNGEFGND